MWLEAVHTFRVRKETLVYVSFLKRLIKKKQKRQWVIFICMSRAKGSPTKNSRLCSEHFKQHNCCYHFVQISGAPFANKSVLQANAVLTIHKEVEEKENNNFRHKAVCVNIAELVVPSYMCFCFCPLEIMLILYLHLEHISVGCKGLVERISSQRWAVILQAYNYQVEYPLSTDHANADELLRPPCNQKPLPEEAQMFLLPGLDELPFDAPDISRSTTRDHCCEEFCSTPFQDGQIM